MKLKRMIFLALIGSLIGGMPGARAQEQCPPLKDADRTRLIDYVQKKYKVPATASLGVTEAPFARPSCFRKLLFQSQEAKSSFRIELFLAPDQRFLTRELLDSTVDPIVEERKKAEALAAGLTRGSFPARGKEDAPVTIAVFSDFQCPYCARFADMLKDVLPDERVRLVFRHLPLPMHPWARPAAEAAACAQEQGNGHFWSLHDFIFEHQKELAPENLQQKLAEFSRDLRVSTRGSSQAVWWSGRRRHESNRIWHSRAITASMQHRRCFSTGSARRLWRRSNCAR
ncbi:MAG: DsbA family protein [Acidobacteriia bacterium]|nr:DsbA family protein [Terriglobia bacterium]